MPESRLYRWGVTTARVLLSAGLVALAGVAAHLPLGAASGDAALRVALRTQLARTEICRDRTDAELAELPAHMRQRRVCTETAATYRLRVRIDGVTRIDRPVTHSGVRHNRPLVVDELLIVPPGDRQVEIEFVPETGDEGAGTLAFYRLAGAVPFQAGRIRIASLRDERLDWLSDPAVGR